MLIRIGVLIGAMTAYLLLFELVVFRFVLLPSDVPASAFIDGLMRYAPNQTGIWRERNEIAAPYAINAQGWNSGVGDYVLGRKAGVGRIALIGDSFIEALRVPHDASVAERLAAELSRDGHSVEAYRFGISGAPLSQYVLMAEREVVRYRPDWMIVLLVENDFSESLAQTGGRYTSSFLHVRVRDGGLVDEVAPRPWKRGAIERLLGTATARYLYYRWQIHPELIRDLLLPRAHAEAARLSGQADVDAVLAQMPDIVAATDYLFGRLAAAATAAGARLLLTMDGIGGAIYAGQAAAPSALKVMAGELARRRGIPFVDLNPAFAKDWQTEHRRLDYLSDPHWNEHGHAVAARAIAQAIRTLR